MKAAIYARKSKETEVGSSTENQIEMCKTQLKFYGIDNFEIFVDEGISGKDLKRPEFIKMMKRIKEKEFTHLICYKLDRLSRSVADFSGLIEDLEKNDVSFISVKEQFDTSSPMGRAMMYMLSVFAQFERESISERVTDNMDEMAKTGKWLAGNPPLGYVGKRIQENGTEYTVLEPDPDRPGFVNLVYQKLFELGSKHSVRKWLKNNGYRGATGSYIGTSVLTTMFTSFVYLEATTESIEYIESLGYKVYNKQKANQGYGFIHYKKKNGNYKDYDISEQIVAVSNHPFMVTLEDYLRVSKIIEGNTTTVNRNNSHTGLLVGLLKCGYCGSTTAITYGKKNKDGSRLRYYICRNKIQYGATHCESKLIRADIVEKNVIGKIKELFTDEERFLNELRKVKRYQEIVEVDYENLITKANKELANILNAITTLGISEELEARYKEKQLEIEKIELLKNNKDDTEKNVEVMVSNAKKFIDLFDDLELPQKKMLLNTIVKDVYYDYEKEQFVLRLFALDRYNVWSPTSSPANNPCIYIYFEPYKKRDPMRQLINKYGTFEEMGEGAKLKYFQLSKGYSTKEMMKMTGYSYNVVAGIAQVEEVFERRLLKFCEALEISPDIIRKS